jgi:DNA-binding NtrC family response regulator
MCGQKILNILVVDDEKKICQMFEKWLSLEGHRVSCANSGEKAVRFVKRELFDIVFLDIVMPGTSSFEVLETIKKISPLTRVILITGRLMDSQTFKELKKKGAADILSKPFKIGDVLNLLKDS